MSAILEFNIHHQLQDSLGKLSNIGHKVVTDSKKGKNNTEKVRIFFKDTGELISTIKYPQDKYTLSKFVELGYDRILRDPIKASTPSNKNRINDCIADPSWYMQHKIDGVRARFYIGKHRNRIFGGSITKSGFYAEYTDNIPHLRELELLKEFEGTLLDGELVHPSGIVPDKKTPGIVNSLPETAWRNQLDNGWLVYIAYDITRYCGADVRKLPYSKRLDLLERIMYDGTCTPWHECFIPILTVQKNLELEGVYYNKRSFLDYIFDSGYEGAILKDPDAPYEHKKTTTNLKVKLEKTYDVIIIGSTPPSKYYTNPNTGKEDTNRLTKYYKEGLIGAIRYGVIARGEEAIKIKAAGGEVAKRYTSGKLLMDIGKCSGMTDEARKMFTHGKSMKIKDKYIGQVMEVKANGIVDLSKGTLRHPRYIRIRKDKLFNECTFKAHLVSS